MSRAHTANTPPQTASMNKKASAWDFASCAGPYVMIGRLMPH
jgi:hypothetical protein